MSEYFNVTTYLSVYLDFYELKYFLRFRLYLYIVKIKEYFNHKWAKQSNKNWDIFNFEKMICSLTTMQNDWKKKKKKKTMFH